MVRGETARHDVNPTRPSRPTTADCVTVEVATASIPLQGGRS